MSRPRWTSLLPIALCACVGSTDAEVAPAIDGGMEASPEAGADTTPSAIDSAGDAAVDGDGGSACAVFGAPGDCVSVSACAALRDHSSYAGHCPGPASIQCCIKTPNVADNPPIPVGYTLMKQSDVTAEMTKWAVDILHDPVTYPMFATTTRVFGTKTVLARVEWHPPDFLNGTIHRGVTLYQPI